MTKTNKFHWKWLESLRGIGALIVFIFHGWLFFRDKIGLTHDIIDLFLFNIFDLGKIGVGIFFLISGYLLPYSMRNKTKKEFIQNRFFRLYPPYWFTILITTLAIGGFSLIQILGNLTMFQLFLGIKDLVGAFWTLPIELLLYIGCLLFFKYIYTLKNIFYGYRILLIITLCSALLRYITDVKIPVAIPLLLSLSCLGYIIRLYKENKLDTTRQLYNNIIIFGITLIISSFLAYNVDMGHGETWYRYVNTYISSILVFLIFMNKNIHNKLFSHFGKISYSLYLTHGVIILLYTKYWDCLDYSLVLILTTFVISTFGLAITTYYGIEKSFFNIYTKYIK